MNPWLFAFRQSMGAVLIVVAMAVHIVKPLGLPGLRRRGDFWKLALLALAAISLTAALSHWT